MKPNKALAFILILSGFASSCNSQKTTGHGEKKPLPADQMIPTDMNTEIATFGAGCFWCVEAVFQEFKGVLKVESGYMGGHVPNPTYREICTGTTGHAEVTKITFDPSQITYDELLEILWTTHDPTTLNRQGADSGTQYRSVVFYQNEDQKKRAEKSKAEVASKIWDRPVVTEITKAEIFYPAEEYHQDYYANNPNAGYCRVVINPKIEKVRAAYGDRLKQ